MKTNLYLQLVPRLERNNLTLIFLAYIRRRTCKKKIVKNRFEKKKTGVSIKGNQLKIFLIDEKTIYIKVNTSSLIQYHLSLLPYLNILITRQT